MKQPIRKIFIIGLLLLLQTISYTQDINFSYDRNGNRTSVRLELVKEPLQPIKDTTLVEPEWKQSAQDLKDYKLIISPNPTSDKIIIQCEHLNNGASVDCYLYSGNGELLVSQKLDSREQAIDLSAYSCGIYYLKIKLGHVTEIWKIMKR